jgi:hypothetical protein
MTFVRRLLREPLVHFLLLGAVLFAWFEWRGGTGSNRIVVTRGQIERLASGFARTWQRTPTDAELKGLVDDYVKEEIASREAMAMGLDRDDTVVRRRLRQKLEFLAEDATDDAPPTDAQLQKWLDAHRAEYQAEPRLAFVQVYLSADRRAAALRKDADRLLERLRQSGPTVDLDAVSDRTMLPREMPLGPLSEVTRTFGGEFARAIDTLPLAQWSGPIPSPYGLHLVRVTERVAGAAPSLAEIRPLVERDFLVERRKERLQAFYDRLLQKYSVTTERVKTAVEPEATPLARADGR